jgi:hypothetical protein
MIREMQKAHRDRETQRLRLLTADSMDVEAQRLIEDEIRQKQVDANMEAAMEYNPESFGTVCMLYINCKVNGVPVKAFIDSGKKDGDGNLNRTSNPLLSNQIKSEFIDMAAAQSSECHGTIASRRSV